MGQIILGLDIGTSTIKGVRLAKGLRGVRLVDSFVRAVPKEGKDGESAPLSRGQIALLKDLISEGKIVGGDLIALSIPGDLISSHEIALPFSDPKKLQQIISYEAEAELPFDLEAVTVDYMSLQNRSEDFVSGQKEAKSRLLVSAIPNETLSAYLQALQPIGIDPAWVGPNPLALYAFSQYFLKATTGNGSDKDELLVIDLGASRTVLCNIYEGALRWVRTIPMGGNLITKTLQKDFDLNWEDAEEKKETIDLNAKNPNAEESKTIAAIQKELGSLITEIEKSLRILSPHHTDETSEIKKTPSFHLCGGGEKLSGLSTMLSKILEMEPAPMDLGPGSRAALIVGVDSINGNLASVYAQAFGIALQESDGPPINFRKGAFAFGKETIEKRRRFATIAFIVLFLLGLMGGNLGLRYSLKENRYQALKQSLRNAFTETFPKIRNVVNEVEQTRAAITMLNRTGSFLGVGEMSPLAVLTEITGAIPDGLKIDVFDIAIDSGKVRMQAQTDSFESVDRIRGGLVGTKYFKGVEVSDAKVMADQSRVRFRIKLTVIEGNKGGKNRSS